MWDLRFSKLLQKSSREISWGILVVFFLFNSGRIIDGQWYFKYHDIPLCGKVPYYLDQFEMKTEEIRIGSLLVSFANDLLNPYCIRGEETRQDMAPPYPWS